MRCGSLSPATQAVLGAGAIAAIPVAALVPGATERYWPLFALVPTCSAAVLIAIGSRGWINRVLLSANAIVFIGLISYPVYLWHWPLLSLANLIEEDVPSRVIRGGLVCLAFVLAWLTWKLVEGPIRKMLPSAASRTRAVWFSTIAVCSLMFIASTGWATHRLYGLPDRYARLEHERLELSEAAFNRYKAQSFACSGPLARGNNLAYCATSKPGAPVAAILGDSHAEHLFPGIADGSSA